MDLGQEEGVPGAMTFFAKTSFALRAKAPYSIDWQIQLSFD